MDLVSVALQMQLDALARDVTQLLSSLRIPHVFLKGPSTADWLYDPPRSYRDVDLLVPRSRLQQVAKAIETQGLAKASAGRYGESASHSLVMLSPNGLELDLHATLPMVSPDHHNVSDYLWNVLGGHVEPMVHEGITLPVLDIPARCLVLSLHALASGFGSDQPREDLVRALHTAQQEDWRQARDLAKRLHVRRIFDEGLSVARPDERPGQLTVDGFLKWVNAPGAAFGLQRLAAAPWREKPGLALREMFPSKDFVQHAYPRVAAKPLGTTRAYLTRWRRIAVEMPASVRLWRAAREQQPEKDA
jgi:hypothetical protein